MPAFYRLYENRIVRTALLACLAVVAAVSLWQGIRNALEFSQDLQWDAAKALEMGLDPYELSIDTQKALKYPELADFYSMFTDRGLTQKMEANQFPSLLALLMPLTFFAPATAKVIWLVLNLFFSAGIAWLLKSTFFERAGTAGFIAMTLVTISGTPYRNQIGVGQHTLFAFFFFMLAVYIEKKKTGATSSVLMSACLAVSYFKYTLTAPLALYFIYRKRYREFAASVLLHVALTEVFAIRLNKSFIYMIKAPLEVASALSSEGGIDLGALFGGKTGLIVGAVFAVLLFCLTLLLQKGREELLFSMLLLWSLVLTYHRTYDFFVLSAASALFYGTVPEVKMKQYFAAGYAALLIFVYFALRIFNENGPAMMAAAVMYYLFTLAVTAVLLQTIINGKRIKENG